MKQVAKWQTGSFVKTFVFLGFFQLTDKNLRRTNTIFSGSNLLSALEPLPLTAFNGFLYIF